jgi:hypothetical protein
MSNRQGDASNRRQGPWAGIGIALLLLLAFGGSLLIATLWLRAQRVPPTPTATMAGPPILPSDTPSQPATATEMPTLVTISESQTADATATDGAAGAATEMPVPTEEPTNTPRPTLDPSREVTPRPTATPRPSETTQPTAPCFDC